MPGARQQAIMDYTGLRYMWLLLGLLALRASADCTSYGVDFASGGSYDIDRTSNQYFSFITVFQGKSARTLVGWGSSGVRDGVLTVV